MRYVPAGTTVELFFYSVRYSSQSNNNLSRSSTSSSSPMTNFLSPFLYMYFVCVSSCPLLCMCVDLNFFGAPSSF